jgi:hypothetical protein
MSKICGKCPDTTQLILERMSMYTEITADMLENPIMVKFNMSIPSGQSKLVIGPFTKLTYLISADTNRFMCDGRDAESLDRRTLMSNKLFTLEEPVKQPRKSSKAKVIEDMPEVVTDKKDVD